MNGTKNQDPTDKAISALNIDPDKAKADAERKAIIDNANESFNRGKQFDDNSAERSDFNYQGSASQLSHAKGYTPLQGDPNSYMAREQSTMQKIGNRAYTFVPSVALGVVELAGHILDSPENVQGLMDGKNFDGSANDFDNTISTWARETNRTFTDNNKARRANPEKIFDFADPAFYINAGADTIESLTEFFATGAGVGKLAGMAAEGLSAAGKGMMLTDMLGTGSKLATNAAKYGQQAVSSLVTAESVAALNSSQVFKDIVDQTMTQRKEDGSFYTLDEAKEIAANNAASTFMYTFATTAALNVTSLAPFLKQGKYVPKSGIKGANKSIKDYSKSLKEILDDPSRLLNGAKTSTWWKRQLTPDSLLGEMAQEGTEEVLENLAQDIGKKGAAQDTGGTFEVDLFSAENGLAFTLGALGGAYGKGVGSLATRNKGKNEKSEFENFIQAQYEAVNKHIKLMDEMSVLEKINTADLSPKEYEQHKLKMTNVQNGLIANSFQKGLEDGSIKIMRQSIQNQIDLDEDEAALAGVNQDRAKGLLNIIDKHQKYVDNLSDDAKDNKTQRYAIQASINKDLAVMTGAELQEEFNSELEMYDDSQKELASIVNELYALNELGDNESLTKNERARKKELEEQLKEIDDEVITSLVNETLASAKYLQYKQARIAKDSAENFAKLKDPRRADKALAEIEAKDAKIQEENNKNKARAVTIMQAELMASKGDSIPEIKEAMSKYKDLLNDESLTEDEKLAYNESYDKLVAIADVRMAELKKKNLNSSNTSNSPDEAKSLAQKMYDGAVSEVPYEIEGEELDYYNNNKALVNRLYKKLLEGEGTIQEPKDPKTDSPTDAPTDSSISPLEPGEQNEAGEVPTEVETVDSSVLTGKKTEGSKPSDGKITSEGPGVNPDSKDGEPKESNQSLSGTTEVATDNTRGANTFLKEFKSIPKTLAEAEALVEELKSRKDFSRYHKIKLGYIIPQIKKLRDSGQTDGTVWVPKVDDDFTFETEQVRDKGDHEYRKDNPLVTEVFETDSNGVLIGNTQQVAVGDDIEIVYDPDWPHYVPDGVKPLLVYRIIDGKRADKPMSEIPYSSKRMNPQAAEIRERFETDESPMAAKVESKNFGDIIRDRNKDGTPGNNSLIAALGNSTMPTLFGVVYKDADLGLVYKVSGYDNKGIELNASQRKAVEQLHNSPVRMGDDTMTRNSKGQHFAVTIAPNGKVVPIYIQGSKLSAENVARLMNGEEGAKNIATILRTGVGFEGKDKLKRLMSISASSDEQVVATLSTFAGNIMVTPTGIFWRTDLGDKIHNNAGEGSWVRIDYKSPAMTKGKGDGPNMLLKFLQKETSGVSLQLLNSKDYDFVEFKGDYNYKALNVKNEENANLYAALLAELELRLTNAYNNIDKDSMNSDGSFQTAFDEDTGMSYNDWVKESGNFTTDLTTDDQKFHNVTTYIQPTKEPKKEPVKKSSDPEVIVEENGRVQIGEVDEKVSNLEYQDFLDGIIKQSILQRIAVDERDGNPLSTYQKEIKEKYSEDIQARLDELKKTEPSPDNTEEEAEDAKYYDDLEDEFLDSPFRLTGGKVAGSFEKMTQREVDWLTAQLGAKNINMIHGVDRIVAIGGQEAFGWFENAMVTLAENAETGSGYHEAFHYVFHMALSDFDRAQVFSDMRELSEGEDLDQVGLEEKAAELFRDYMLNKDNTPIKKRSKIAEFFDGLVAWINNMLGKGEGKTRTYTDGLFQDISSGKWKSRYANNFGQSVDPGVKRLRAIPGFSIIKQRESITDASARVLDVAEDMAIKIERESGIKKTFDSILSNKKSLEQVLNKVRAEYDQFLKDNREANEKISQNRKNATYNERLLQFKYKVAEQIIGSWDLTDAESKEDNPPASFKNELVKSFTSYGFSVVSKVSITPAEDLMTPEELEREENQLSEKEYIYNLDVALKSTKASVSMALKRKLSLLPDYELNDDNTVKIIDGNPVPKLTIFGTPKRQEFNKVYSNVKNALTDVPMGEMMYEKIKSLSEDSPIFAALLYNLDQAKKNDQLGKFSDGFYADFMSSFNNASLNMKTFQSGKKTANGRPKVMNSDRGAIHFQVVSGWRESANNLRLVDTSYEPYKEKWSKILADYEAEMDALPSDEKKWANGARKIFFKYNKLIGMNVNPRVITKATARRKGNLRLVMNDFKAIIERGASGVDPFGYMELSNKFAKPQTSFENDLNSGSFHSGSKQYHSVNMPSFLSDFITNINNNDKTGLLETLSSDPFNVPDPSQGEYVSQFPNMLLEHLMKNDNHKTFKYETSLEYNDGSGNSTFSELNFEGSFVQKLIGFTSGKKGEGSFSIGTLSDKLKNLSFVLPSQPDIVKAKEFYIEAMKRSVMQEAKRISLVNSNPEFAEIFVRGDRFNYVEGANDIKELKASVSKGEITVDEFNELYENGQLDVVIREQMVEDLADMHSVLVNEGILEEDEDGNITPSNDVKDAMGIHGSESLMKVIDNFLLTDKVWKMESSKLVMGDIAKYPEFWKYFKRMYQPITNGRRAFVGTSLKDGLMNASQKNTHSRLIIKSPHEFASNEELHTISQYVLNNDKLQEISIEYLDDMISQEKDGKSLSSGNVFRKLEGIKKSHPGEAGILIANAVYIAYSYRENNIADAAAYCSIDFYRDQMLGLGQWSDEHEWVFNNVWKAKVTIDEAVLGLSKEEAGYYKRIEKGIFASTLKPFYYGQRVVEFDNEDGGKFNHMFNEQFKESISPILPIWGEQIQSFSYLLDQFNDNNVDVVSTNDSVKVGIIKSQEADVGDPNPTIRRDIPTSNLRYPQVPAKPKPSAKAGIQLEKSMMSNLIPGEGNYRLFGRNVSDVTISNSFHDAWAEKISRSKTKVLKELGIDDGVPQHMLKGNAKKHFLVKMRAIVEDAVISEDLPDSYLEALNIEKIGEDDWDYELGLDFEPYARKYQNIILSHIKKNVITQKMPGGSMVNMGDLEVRTDDSLKFMRVSKAGKILPAEIAMTFGNAKALGVGWGIDSIKLDENGNSLGPTVDEKGNVIFNRLLPWQKKGLETVLYRIPTQMKSSAMPAIIKRILPDGDGAKVMLPGRTTTQAGLDFDFDKSYFMLRHPGEDHSAPRDGTEMEDFTNKQLDNHIFDMHWSIMNNIGHFEEMMTPISSRSHDELLEQKGVPEELKVKEDPFSLTSNIVMENLAKYSQSLRGSASDAAAGHNVLVNIASVANVTDFITIQNPIGIEMKNGYKFDELGRQKDAYGKYISENHSENLNSALDSQADPKLGKLNVSIFNYGVNAYMNSLGVPESIAKHFMNTPAILSLANNYYKRGGRPFDMNDALEDTLEDLGIKFSYISIESTKKSDRPSIKENDLMDQSFMKEDQEYDGDFQALVLFQFMKYTKSARELSKLNNMLKSDGWKDGDAASIRITLNKHNSLFTPGGSITVKKSLFDLETSPIKRIAAFREDGLELGVDILRRLTPYFSVYYNQSFSMISKMQNDPNINSWDIYNRMNELISLSLLSNSTRDNKDFIDNVSEGFNSRISLFAGTDLKTMPQVYQDIKDKFPHLNKNIFFQRLNADEFNSRFKTQLLKFPSSAANEQGLVIDEFQRLLEDKNPEVVQFAKDLIAYGLHTSGISKNDHGFIQAIPIKFWKDSGLGGMMRDIKNDVKMYNDNFYEDEEFTGRKFPIQADIIIRHMVGTSLVKAVELKDKHYSKGIAIIPAGYSVMPKRIIDSPPRYIKTYTKSTGKFQMLKYGGIENGKFSYFKVDSFGEGNRLNEMFLHGDNIALGESMMPAGNVVVDYKKKQSKNTKIDPTTRNVDIAVEPSPGDEITHGNIHGDPDISDGPDPQEPPTMSEEIQPDVPSGVTTQSLFGQLPGTGLSEDSSESLLSKLNTFLDNNGITTTIVASMMEKFGADYDGIADAVNKAIYLAKGVRGENAKVEEVAHIYIESTLETRQTKKMLEMVDGTEEYEAVKKAYGEIYKNDDNRLRREAAAKILAKHLADRDTYMSAERGKLRRALDALVNMIKRLFGKMNPYVATSDNILKGAKIKSGNVQNGYMYKVNGEATLEAPVQDEPDISPEDLIKIAEINESITTDQPIEPKINDELSEEEIINISSIMARDKFNNVSEILDKVVSSTKLKLRRMRKQGIDRDDISEVKSLLTKMRAAKDSKALLAYMENVDKKLSNIELYIYNPAVSNSLSLGEIDDMRTEVDSFNVVDDILVYIGENVDIKNAEDRRELSRLVDASLKRRKLISARLARLNRDSLAPLLHSLTNEELTIDQVKSELVIGTGNVNVVDKMIRPGMDSKDLLVRTTHKLLQDHKQASFKRFYDKMRSNGGFMDSNEAYEAYAKSQGIDITNMETRNEQFVTESKGKYYLVNKNQGSEKYNKIMALDPTHPVRRYYEAMESMLVGTQDIVFGDKKKPLGYEIPRVRKDTYERLSEKGISGIASNIKDAWKNFSEAREDYDYDIRPKESYIVDENNKPVRTVPLYYTGKMDQDEVSLDIASSIALFAQNTYDHGAMSDIKGVMAGIQSIANERKVVKSKLQDLMTGKMSPVMAGLGMTSKDDASDANSNQQVTAAINRLFYGELSQEGFKFNLFGKEFTAAKFSNAITKFTSSKIMGFNVHIPLSNALTGEAQILQEAIGGEFFGMEDWLWAGKQTTLQLGNLAADEWRTSNESKIGGLIEFLNLKNDFKLAYDSVTQKRGISGSLYEKTMKASNSMSRLSETLVMAHTIGAMTSSIKVQDADGKDVKLYDVIDNSSGHFSVREGYTYKGKPLEDNLELIRQRMLFAHQNMHGVYNQIDSPAMNAYILGKHMSFMRGWLFVPLSRRFDTKRFSERTGTYREGSYMTVMNILANTYGKGGFLSQQSDRVNMLLSPLYNKEKSRDLFLTEDEVKTLSESQQDALIDHRQANVRKSASEVAMITLLSLLLALVYDDDEPDEDDNQFIRYHMLRLKRELFFYNPFELLELHKNPAIAFVSIGNVLDLTWRTISFWNWMEEDSKGKNVYAKKFSKTTPWVNQWYKWDDLKKQANAIEQGFR